MGKNKEIGVKGELAAENYLISHGYTIKQRNFRFGRWEIDLIAEKDEVLIFIEVKSRTTSMFGSPEEAVTSKKIDNILTCAGYYIDEIGWQKHIRFDIISVYLSRGTTIKHIEDAFS